MKRRREPSTDQSADGSLKRRAVELLEDRKKLPIWSESSHIRTGLREGDVLLLVGETGSGKSTQVPQFLLDEPWCRAKMTVVKDPDHGQKKISVGGCIAVTQPRRVAAISLARRVAAEMGTPLGSSSPVSRVGYSVRFDRSVSPSTRIIYMTEGMLLQELLRDPWLRHYSAVIVDEVHERSVNVDLVLGFLRRLLMGNLDGRGGIPLKVAVMSATADLAGLQSYFDDESADPVKSRVKHTTQPLDTEDAGLVEDESYSSWSGFSDAELPTVRHGKPLESRPGQRVRVCKIKGRQYPVQVHYLPKAALDLMECAFQTILEIHKGEAMPGDILVFMTGQEEIEMLETLIEKYASQMPSHLPKVSPASIRWFAPVDFHSSWPYPFSPLYHRVAKIECFSPRPRRT